MARKIVGRQPTPASMYWGNIIWNTLETGELYDTNTDDDSFVITNEEVSEWLLVGYGDDGEDSYTWHAWSGITQDRLAMDPLSRMVEDARAKEYIECLLQGSRKKRKSTLFDTVTDDGNA